MCVCGFDLVVKHRPLNPKIMDYGWVESPCSLAQVAVKVAVDVVVRQRQTKKLI